MAKRFATGCFLLVFLMCVQNLIAGEKIPVFVSIVPQKYFVEKIGGDRVEVRVMVKPGASPATYEPKPSQMAALSQSRLYFSIGVPFEKIWLPKIASANPEMKVIRTDREITKVAMAAHHHEEEEGANEDHHEEAGLDPHIWLSPPLVKVQAHTVLQALQSADPSGKIQFAENHKRFMQEIDALDAGLKELFKTGKGKQFMVFHPSWGYFARAYGLEQIPIEAEGKNPKPHQLRELIEHARDEGIRVVFVQPQFSTKSAELIAREIRGQVVFADPLAENWIENLSRVAGKFRQALQ